ncbi:MAG: copper homeostasis protein CutC [Bythopirellula sp.]
MNILLEICIDSIESASAAKAGGADRLEVCSSLSAGGTTPSFGLVKRCITDIELPVMMMIRPHDGGFVYHDEDIATMLTDIEVARSLGVQGVVFGALTADRQIHRQHCRRLLDAAGSLETTFHRAFDVVANPSESLDVIMELGFDRLLTSGQSAVAEAGAALIRQLCDRAQKRIVLMAGAGVSPQNARQIADVTGVRELHASAAVPQQGQSQGSVAFGSDGRVTSVELVRAIKQSLG